QHELIILCRNKALGEQTVKELGAVAGNGRISFVLCNLARMRDVHRAIREIKYKHNYLDALFMNAGLGYAAQRVETEDGLMEHFQVNYLSQFMLALNLLSLLEKSAAGGRIIFNVIEHGEIYWNDLQMTSDWKYKKALLQAMAAKRLLMYQLHRLYSVPGKPAIAFTGFQIPKTVWTNQLNIIPASMRIMATVARWFGQFMSINECGEIMAPLFLATKEESLLRSGKFLTWKHNRFVEITGDAAAANPEAMERLWRISVQLCADEETARVAKELAQRRVAQPVFS
ncbi:MAG: SDR family NAD(P)-dependent oxidoreductase, partial [Dinghuibacter sp.]|nr:SDR family NAD(P)-dependent oxidoreductase [Dinghuibacter sp.]